MKYETVIGLEVHVELATEQKIFCQCSTKFGQLPNTQCCPVCTGMPGTLPVLNAQVVDFAIAAGLATNCQIMERSAFDRKNYFYPDLPKGYQITQFYEPICQNGYLKIETAQGAQKTIRIREIHMEEDAGKLTYDEKNGVPLVDYNRCGVPLLELVTQPDFCDAQEVIAFLEQLKNMLQFIGISDCKMQEGSLRVDVNLSVKPAGSTSLGTRTEMKNLNSFKAIARAIAAERDRQIAVLEEGGTVSQETRRWDDLTGISQVMRSKEEACDYRYFPEPDLKTVFVSQEQIASVKNALPELPEARKLRYMRDFALSLYDAAFLTGSKVLADLFEQINAVCQNPKDTANWLMGEWMQLLHEKEISPEETEIDALKFGQMIQLVNRGVINRNAGKQVLKAVWQEGADPEAYVQAHNLAMVCDTAVIESAIDAVLSDNPQSVADYKNGKEKAFGFFMGQVMKALKGKASPELVNRLLKEKLKLCIMEKDRK